MSSEEHILVIIPTYNEFNNLEQLTARIPKVPGLSLLFIDDHSTDGTAEWIRARAASQPDIHLIERPSKLGLGTAYVAGFKWALERGFDYVFEMDADLSHDPAEIPRFLQKMREGADLVIGSRYAGGVRVINWPLSRLMLSIFAAWYTRFWTGLPLEDPTSGFKCFRRKVLETLDFDSIRSNGYAFQIEVSDIAWRAGFRLEEIPIIFTDRPQSSGTASKMNKRIVFEAILIVPRLRMHSLCHKRRA